MKADLIGKKFGHIEVIDFFETRTEFSKKSNKVSCRAYWVCVCDCGRLSIKPSNKIAKHTKQMCPGCAYASRPQSTQRYSALERYYNLAIVGRCKQSKHRIQNNLSIQEFAEIISKPCHYDDTPPRPIDYIYRNNIYAGNEYFIANGVDRIDSSKGYSKDNCVPCCPACNFIKRDMPLDKFFEKIHKIATKHNLNNGHTKINKYLNKGENK